MPWAVGSMGWGRVNRRKIRSALFHQRGWPNPIRRARLYAASLEPGLVRQGGTRIRSDPRGGLAVRVDRPPPARRCHQVGGTGRRPDTGSAVLATSAAEGRGYTGHAREKGRLARDGELNTAACAGITRSVGHRVHRGVASRGRSCQEPQVRENLQAVVGRRSGCRFALSSGLSIFDS